MPLQVPSLGNADYRAILAEALARIPVHNPEWTNFNDSDPGVTLLQLFAFISENVLYRANLIPERNRIKFLKLLGVPVRPAASARGFVTFGNARAPLKTRTLEANVEVLAGKVPFRTAHGLDVLPVEGRVFYKARSTSVEDAGTRLLYEQLYASLSAEGATTLDFYETAEQEPASDTLVSAINLSETLDGCLWIALLAPAPTDVAPARREIANKRLSLGILPVPDPAMALRYAGGAVADEHAAVLVFECPDLQRGADGGVLPLARYRPLVDAPLEGVNPLREPGVVELELPDEGDLGVWTELDPLEPGTGDFPPFLEDETVEGRVVTWVRVRISNAAKVGPNGGRLHIVGINAAMVTQRAHVTAEFIGLGNGQPDQSFTLVNTPVIEDSLRLTVNGEPWQRVEDLSTAGAEVGRKNQRTELPTTPASTETLPVNVFSVDRESGELRFGDGLHGRRPPRNAVIQAAYDYGGGLQGLVGVAAINKATSLPPGLEVTNQVRTWGGAEAETVAEAEKNIPAFLRQQDRLITGADFEEITLRTPGLAIGRVEVLPLFRPATPATTSATVPGVVTVLVIPKYDLAHPDTPEPDQVFLEAVCRYLQPRRLITTELHVRGPEYLSLYVSVGIEVVAGQEFAPIREAVKGIIRQFLSALTGGFEVDGWPLERPAQASELLAVAARVPGVSQVNEVLLGTVSGSAVTSISLTGLQLPRLEGIGVQSGSAQSLDELRGDQADTPSATTRTPVPVIPDEC